MVVVIVVSRAYYTNAAAIILLLFLGALHTNNCDVVYMTAGVSFM